MNQISLKYKLWFSSEERKSVFGDGKYFLLMAIESEGSLSAAAKKLKISYRKAWGDLKKAETGLNIQLIDKCRGGKDGGRSKLTSDGKKMILAYTEFRESVEKQLDRSFNEIIGEFKKN